MKDCVKLSVLITTYNLEKYVEETLESVVGQKTEFDFEILVGDDGSSDGTIELIKKWQEKYPEKIRLFVMDREPGKKYNRISRASRNRINLLKHARGEYLIFLDGDDVYTDMSKLQKQVDILNDPQNQGCVACAHNIYVYWNEEKKYLLNTAQEAMRISGRKYWKYGMYFHSDTIMFRNIFRDGFPTNIHPDYYDDNIIMYCLLEHGDIYYIPDVMANYRQLENSSWNSVSDAEKNLINLLDLDIEGQINPAYGKESVMRHLYSIVFLWRHSEEITEELFDKYSRQIEKDCLYKSKKWLEYSQAGVYEKCRMTVWLGVQLCRFVVLKLCKRLPGNRVNP